MHKSISIRNLVFLFSFLSFGFICANTANQPNIIYILADDLGYGDLSFLGQKHFRTPNIDQLAKDGM